MAQHVQSFSSIWRKERIMSRSEAFSEGFPISDVQEFNRSRGGRFFRGRLGENVTGFRAVNADELDSIDNKGWMSRGKFNLPIERGRRGSTMFSSVVEPEMRNPGRYSHVVTADISGLPVRTLRAPEDGRVRADLGLGVGVTQHMNPQRIQNIEANPPWAQHWASVQQFGASNAGNELAQAASEEGVIPSSGWK